jgi:hypothetical protein
MLVISRVERKKRRKNIPGPRDVMHLELLLLGGVGSDCPPRRCPPHHCPSPHRHL